MRIEGLVKSIHDKVSENARLHAGLVRETRGVTTAPLKPYVSSPAHPKWLEIANTAASSPDWSLAFVNQSLTPQDEAFLRTHTTQSIGLTSPSDLELKDHVLDILKKTVSIVVTTCVVSMIYESIRTEDATPASNHESKSIEVTQPSSTTPASHRNHSLLSEKLMDVSRLELMDGGSSLDVGSTSLMVKFHLNHHDPFFVKMTHQTESHVFRLLKKFSLNELNSFLNDTKISAAEQSFLSALGRGQTLQAAGADYLRAIESGNAANKTIVRGVQSLAGGVILADKIRTNGLLETVVDTTKNFILKKLIADPVSYGVSTLLRANPATLGPMIATSIMSSLEPTLTAPSWQDEHPSNPQFPQPLDVNQVLSTPVTEGPVIRPAAPVEVPAENYRSGCCIM